MKCSIYTVDGHRHTMYDPEADFDDFIDDTLPCYGDAWIRFKEDGRDVAIQIRHIVRIVRMEE